MLTRERWVNDMVYESEPLTERLYVTDFGEHVTITIHLGADRLEKELDYRSCGKLMEALSDCIVNASMEGRDGRWEIP